MMRPMQGFRDLCIWFIGLWSMPPAGSGRPRRCREGECRRRAWGRREAGTPGFLPCRSWGKRNFPSRSCRRRPVREEPNVIAAQLPRWLPHISFGGSNVAPPLLLYTHVFPSVRPSNGDVRFIAPAAYESHFEFVAGRGHVCVHAY